MLFRSDQKERGKILFKQFPEIEEAYKYCLRIRKWYEPIRPRYSDRKYKIKETDLMLITKEGMESEVEEIRNIANFLRSNSTPILRYFYRRESNAKAEALNQNLQRFISVNYGARNTDFFLYRVSSTKVISFYSQTQHIKMRISPSSYTSPHQG